MTESEMELHREREELLKQIRHWRELAGGLFVILVVIVLYHYFPSVFERFGDQF